MKINFIDPIYCQVTPAVSIAQIKKCFEYESVRWKRGAYKKDKSKVMAYHCNHPHRGWFHAGLLPRVMNYCADQDIEVEIDPNPFSLPVQGRVHLPSLELREDQNNLISLVNKYGRGIIQSPTGSGKTVIAGGIISQHPKATAVFCVHTQALFDQTIVEFTRWFGDDEVGWIGQKGFNPRRITILMVQKGLHLLEDPKYLGLLANTNILIVDEAHHAGTKGGQYSFIFENCLAYIRIGFTATPLKSGREQLICEGYLGPIIGELSLEEGIQKGILVKPRLKLIPVSKVSTDCTKYRDLYKHMIILNKVRNRLIAKEAASQVRQGNSVLIMITDVVNHHGEIIKEMLREFYDVSSELVHGETERNLREKIKLALQSKQVKCVIVTSAWREGINIPSLDCVINGIGGKSETMVLQAIGRGLRTSEGKEELLIIDFLDPYPYLAEHTVARLKIYEEMGILNLKE
ncbi:MAG: DEAD/DEAH box helicase [Candidatus Paceibacterota bacterium]|jgi:superfamily II DNA or RNA helicase